VSYVYGTPSKIELRYPDSPVPPSTAFKRTHLVYAGPTGAFAYSFSRAGVEYVLYSISGAQGFQRQGILAYIPGAPAPLANLRCEADSVVESEDPALTDLTLGWPENEQLAEHGLPF